MSAQQCIFCSTWETDSPGTTGVNAARATARNAKVNRADNFIAAIISQPTICESARAVDTERDLCYWFCVLARIAISILTMAAFLAGPVHVSARTCIVSDAPIQKACQPGCCANKACCATSTKKSAPLPFAKNASAPELTAISPPSISMSRRELVSQARQFSVSRELSLASSPRLAVLCTFLI